MGAMLKHIQVARNVSVTRPELGRRYSRRIQSLVGSTSLKRIC